MVRNNLGLQRWYKLSTGRILKATEIRKCKMHFKSYFATGLVLELGLHVNQQEDYGDIG